MMNSQQYEELCRHFLAKKLGMNIDHIRSIHIPNPNRPGLPKFKHQIDLYWETKDDLGLYLHIADAKWRGNDKVDQPEVLLLQQVKQNAAAHKALMLTNQGYTTGAVAVAKHEGIALHIVKPNFIDTILPARDRSNIQAKLNEVASTLNQPVFLHEIVHKAFDFRKVTIQNQFSSPFSGGDTKIISGYETKVAGGYSHKAITRSPETKSGGPSKTK